MKNIKYLIEKYITLKVSDLSIVVIGAFIIFLVFLSIFLSCFWFIGLNDFYKSHPIIFIFCIFIAHLLFQIWYIKHEFSFIENNLKEYCLKVSEENSNLRKDFKKSFKNMGEFISDIKLYVYDIASKYFDTKSHPAHKKAQDVRELKQKTKEYIKEYKLMRYEYDMLFSLFPELENYLEYYSAEKAETIEEVKENYDYVQSWISKNEYSSLDENTRNQLALDRYIESRKKSKWAIGRDYEMFIGHEYEKKGYKVTYTGITDRLEDKGRDLIAQKDNEILIIQCKNWSKYKEIHENHICQLFGTTVQYNIENNSLFKATPVFITSATLSETALKFAEYLGVQVIQNKKLEEFPRIKCNINNKEKIYHLNAEKLLGI